jgi:hypothetical protein
LLDNLKDSRVGFNEDSLEAARVSVNDIPPPRKFADLATHPEGKDYLASIIREINSFDENGMTEVPDIDVKDIPPELILQLMVEKVRRPRLLEVQVPHRRARPALEKYFQRSGNSRHGKHGDRQDFLGRMRSCSYDSI